MTPDLPLLFSDADLAAFDKPSGLPIHAPERTRRARSAESEQTAVALASAQIGPVFPLHRLDRATSGVWLVARNADAARALSAAFEARRIEKRYLALVRGEIAASGDIDHPVPKDEDGPRVPARTSFVRVATLALPDSMFAEAEALGVRTTYSLVEASPHTGRFHQIRRHLKHLGHPIVGDVNYGRGEINRFFRERFDLTRLFLHCAALAWSSDELERWDTERAPASPPEVRRVSAPLPDALRAVVAALRERPAGEARDHMCAEAS